MYFHENLPNISAEPGLFSHFGSAKKTNTWKFDRKLSAKRVGETENKKINQDIMEQNRMNRAPLTERGPFWLGP